MNQEVWDGLQIGDCVADYRGAPHVVIGKSKPRDRFEYLLLPGESLPEVIDPDAPGARIALVAEQWTFVARSVFKTTMEVATEADNLSVFFNYQKTRMAVTTYARAPVVTGLDTLSITLVSNTPEPRGPNAHAALRELLGRRVEITVKIID